MKKRIFVAVMSLCLLAATDLVAQNPAPASAPAPALKKSAPTAEQIAQRQTERMTQQLNLTDAQAKKVYEVNLEQVKQMQSHRDQMREARNNEAEQMKKILTTEQFMQWSQMQGPRPGAGRGEQAMHRGHRRPHGDMDKCPAHGQKKGQKPCRKECRKIGDSSQSVQ